ncbi:hypothetical protein [Pseudonocardia acaciae]|uniref:hypothetical protein n=1 Tax=Pseudonocardia acaciae TaxID=551276 RepID=UPI000490C1DA|nr:hypothetical protein [Pseudonocardia acaciae]
MLSERYLRWARELVGVDRLLFATDYPFEFAPAGGARRFLQNADLSDTDRARIASARTSPPRSCSTPDRREPGQAPRDSKQLTATLRLGSDTGWS